MIEEGGSKQWAVLGYYSDIDINESKRRFEKA
jgi:hypothetical protein